VATDESPTTSLGRTADQYPERDHAAHRFADNDGRDRIFQPQAVRLVDRQLPREAAHHDPTRVDREDHGKAYPTKMSNIRRDLIDARRVDEIGKKPDAAKRKYCPENL
jgi:hypothetical protein